MLPAWLLYGKRLTLRTGIALAVAFDGLLVVAVSGGGGEGAILSLLAAVPVTAGTLMVGRLGDIDVVVASAAHFLFGGVVLAVAAALVEGPPTVNWTPHFVAVLAFLSLVGTAAGVRMLEEKAYRPPETCSPPSLENPNITVHQ